MEDNLKLNFLSSEYIKQQWPISFGLLLIKRIEELKYVQKTYFYNDYFNYLGGSCLGSEYIC